VSTEAAISHDELRRTAQNAKARAVRLTKLARKDKKVADLLDDHAALQTSVEKLRADHAQVASAHAILTVQHDGLRAQHESLGAEASRLQSENVELRLLAEQRAVRITELEAQLAEAKASAAASAPRSPRKG